MTLKLEGNAAACQNVLRIFDRELKLEAGSKRIISPTPLSTAKNPIPRTPFEAPRARRVQSKMRTYTKLLSK